MRNRIVVVSIYITVLLIVVGICRYYYMKSVLWRERAETATETLLRQTKTLKVLQAQQRDVAKLDELYTGKINEANKNNAILRARLADGSHRMRITPTKPSHDSASPTGCMGHDAPIELPTNTGQNILTIREGIIRDQQKIMYLQDYINKLTFGFNQTGKKNSNDNK